MIYGHFWTENYFQVANDFCGYHQKSEKKNLIKGYIFLFLRFYITEISYFLLETLLL